MLLFLVIDPETDQQAFFNEEKEFIRWGTEDEYQVIRKLQNEGLLSSLDGKELEGFELPEPHEGE